MFYKKVEDVPKEISFNKDSKIAPPPPPPPSTFFKTNSRCFDFLPPIPKLNHMHSYITIKKSKGPHKYSKFDDKYKNFNITNKKSKKAEITPKA